MGLSLMMSYMQQLLATPDQTQEAIARALHDCQVVPVGFGYIDLIVSPQHMLALMQRLTAIQVAVQSVSWWCHCTPESKAYLGCPHGYGGPSNPYGEGWFSECGQYPDLDVEPTGATLDPDSADALVFTHAYNDHLIAYLTKQLPIQPFYRPCLCPGLWLYIPAHWNVAGRTSQR